MTILAECLYCRRKQSLRNKKCIECGSDIDKQKRSKKVRYWINFRLPGGKQRREPVGYSIQEARDADGKRRGQKREGRIFDMLPRTDTTFNAQSEWYLNLDTVKTLAMAKVIRIHLDRFNNSFGNIKIGELKATDVNEFKAKLKIEGLSDSYIDQIVGSVQTMVKAAVDNDMVSADSLKPFVRSKKLLKRNSNARDMVFSNDQYNALYRYSPPHLAPIIATAFYTGMRKSEIINLRWSQIDFKAGFIRLEASDTKDREPRLIPLPSPLKNLLKGIPRHLHIDQIFTFRGKPIKDIRTGLINTFQKAEIPYGRKTPNGFTFHDFRHTFNTNMRRAGVPEVVIMKITGHSTREMFDRYSTVDKEDMIEAVGRIEKLISVC